MRFDDITRVEKYFSATVLPYLFAFNNFEGLNVFFELLNLKSQAINSKTINISEFKSNISSIQLLTEPSIERDLSYYRIVIPSAFYSRKQAVTSVPDILIIYSNWIVLVECKFFLSYSPHSLYEQMQKQAYLMDIISGLLSTNITNSFHVGITPYGENLKEFFSLSWREVYDKMATVIPEDDYFLNRLGNAVNSV